MPNIVSAPHGLIPSSISSSHYPCANWRQVCWIVGDHCPVGSFRRHQVINLQGRGLRLAMRQRCDEFSRCHRYTFAIAADRACPARYAKVVVACIVTFWTYHVFSLVFVSCVIFESTGLWWHISCLEASKTITAGDNLVLVPHNICQVLYRALTMQVLKLLFY